MVDWVWGYSNPMVDWTQYVVIVYVICLCVGTLWELTKRWLTVLDYVSGTSDDRMKVKA